MKDQKSSYFALVLKQFRRNKLAVGALWFVAALVIVALGADFIANDRPLFLVYDGRVYYPALRGILVDQGLTTFQPEFRNKKFKRLIHQRPRLEESVGYWLGPAIEDGGRRYRARTGEPEPKRIGVAHKDGISQNENLALEERLRIKAAMRDSIMADIERQPGFSGISFLDDSQPISGFHPGQNQHIWYVLFPPIPFSPNDFDLNAIIQPPSARHWLGTDDTGRDLASRLIHGTRISLSIGLVAVSIYITIGVILGSLAGYFGGWIDITISRVIELMICFPVFFLILAIVAYLPQSIYNIMIVIGVTGWAGVARLVRGEFLRMRDIDYVQAARALGFPTSRIIFRHILPNALAPVFVSATFGVAVAILTESSLSFLGFGVPPNVASWGSILAQARIILPAGWWITTFPGLAIFMTVTVLNLVGEGLRDAMDPRLARR